jgi:hypothetical protein
MRFAQQVALVTGTASSIDHALVSAIGVGNGAPGKACLSRVYTFLQARAPSRIMAPEERASKDTSDINGALLPVDGGWFAARLLHFFSTEQHAHNMPARSAYTGKRNWAGNQCGPRTAKGFCCSPGSQEKQPYDKGEK